jgi:ABC-type branched-subunit amino acid transport system ATPase component
LGRDFGVMDTLALRVADDVVILNTGRIVYDGPAEDTRNQPELLHAHLGIY